MTVLEQPRPGGGAGGAPPLWQVRTAAEPLLPDERPLQMLGGSAARGVAEMDPELLARLYRCLVTGRRFNQQATTLTRQGRLAVYPSSTGQEACQVAVALALGSDDWLFPSYRDTLAVTMRGVDPVAVLTLLRGDWHSGYDPYEHCVAPLSTPLATQLPHAVGLAHAARLTRDRDLSGPATGSASSRARSTAGTGTPGSAVVEATAANGRKTQDPDYPVTLAMVGDGGTSEGDFHEALNFAGVWHAPVVFFVQNNGFAISVPLDKQTAAPSLAHKAVGYGMPGRLVDGNDVVAVYQVLREAVERARGGGGPTLVEAVTYRIEAHTNADDATRYRAADEVAAWRRHDPLELLEGQLRELGILDDAQVREATDQAEAYAADLRERMSQEPALDPMDLFEHVYSQPTTQLIEQMSLLRAELDAEAEFSGGGDSVTPQSPQQPSAAEVGPGRTAGARR